MYAESGTLKIKEANKTTIPVFVSIYPEKGIWYLTAQALHMDLQTRVSRHEEKAYQVTADNQAELKELLEKHILPLYEEGRVNYENMLVKKLLGYSRWSPHISDTEYVAPTAAQVEKARREYLDKHDLTPNLYRRRPGRHR